MKAELAAAANELDAARAELAAREELRDDLAARDAELAESATARQSLEEQLDELRTGFPHVRLSWPVAPP